MKLIVVNPNRRRGSVVLILLAFLVLMTMLCAATWQVVYTTRQEVNLIEKHQIKRLATATNAPPASAKSTNAP